MNLHRIPILGTLLNIVALFFMLITGISMIIVSYTADKNLAKTFVNALLTGLNTTE